MNDPRIVKLSSRFVSVIIRRPQAYRFRGKYGGVDIPGISILTPDGKLFGSEGLKGANTVERVVDLLKKALKKKP